MEIKISNLWILTIDGKAYPKIFISKDKAIEYQKSLGYTDKNSSINHAFIDEK